MSLNQDVTAVTSAQETILAPPVDRKSTRLNSSHANISYAVFCLKKKHSTIPFIASLPVSKAYSTTFFSILIIPSRNTLTVYISNEHTSPLQSLQYLV